MLTYAKETIRHKAEAHTLGMERFMVSKKNIQTVQFLRRG